MTETGPRRMILRRTSADAPTSAEMARRVHDTPDITVLQETSPSSLLVEGTPQTLSRAMAGVAGWTSLPVTTYQEPDARPKVLKPPSE